MQRNDVRDQNSLKNMIQSNQKQIQYYKELSDSYQKSLDQEQYQNIQLAQLLNEAKKDIINKSSTLKQLEKEIQLLKGNEIKYQQTIQYLQESFYQQKQQQQQQHANNTPISSDTNYKSIQIANNFSSLENQQLTLNMANHNTSSPNCFVKPPHSMTSRQVSEDQTTLLSNISNLKKDSFTEKFNQNTPGNYANLESSTNSNQNNRNSSQYSGNQFSSISNGNQPNFGSTNNSFKEELQTALPLNTTTTTTSNHILEKTLSNSNNSNHMKTKSQILPSSHLGGSSRIDENNNQYLQQSNSQPSRTYDLSPISQQNPGTNVVPQRKIFLHNRNESTSSVLSVNQNVLNSNTNSSQKINNSSSSLTGSALSGQQSNNTLLNHLTNSNVPNSTSSSNLKTQQYSTKNYQCPSPINTIATQSNKENLRVPCGELSNDKQFSIERTLCFDSSANGLNSNNSNINAISPMTNNNSAGALKTNYVYHPGTKDSGKKQKDNFMTVRNDNSQNSSFNNQTANDNSLLGNNSNINNQNALSYNNQEEPTQTETPNQLPNSTNQTLTSRQINFNNVHQQATPPQYLSSNSNPKQGTSTTPMSNSNHGANKLQPNKNELAYLMNGKNLNKEEQDYLDSIVNIVQQDDEPANLESIGGSHFKLSQKSDQNFIQIKSDDYFSQKEGTYPTQPTRRADGINLKLKSDTEYSEFDSNINQQTNEHNEMIGKNELLRDISSNNRAKQNISNHEIEKSKSQAIQLSEPFSSNLKYQLNANDIIQYGAKHGMHDSNFANIGIQEKILSKMDKNVQKKEPGKLKKNLEKGPNTGVASDIGQRIFEGFMIYGPNRQELSQIEPSKNSIISLSPKLHFKYPEDIYLDQEQENVFPHFAFPFGVDTQSLTVTDSLSQINQIIFSNNIAESNNNCFVFVMKTDQSYLKKQNYIKVPDHIQVLQSVNPSNLLYGICFKIQDLMQQGEKIKEDPNVLGNLQSQYFYNFFNHQCKKILNEIRKISLPSPNTKLTFKFENEQFEYLVKGKDKLRHTEAEWGSSLVLSNFDVQEFSLILLSMLMETSIVFVSKSAALLSSTLLLYHSLIKPFKWPHPLIFNLPERFTSVFDSPFPVLVGLNRDKSFVFDNQLIDLHPNCCFVMLDETVEFYNDDLVHPIKESSNRSTFKLMVQKLKKLFDALNKTDSNNSIIANNEANYFSTGQGPDINMKSSKSNYNSTSNTSHTQLNYKSTGISGSGHHPSNNNSYSNVNTYLNGQNTNNDSGVRSKSFIMTATDAVQSLIGSSNYNQQTKNYVQTNTSRRRNIIYSPNQEEKELCLKIMSSVSEFIKREFLDYLPSQPIYLENRVLDFLFMSDAMVKSKGYDDFFIQKFVQTQLFTYFLEQKYDSLN